MSTSDSFCAGHEVSDGPPADASPPPQSLANLTRAACASRICAGLSANARFIRTSGIQQPVSFHNKTLAPLLHPHNFFRIIGFY